ncbi:MAG: protein kinase [Gemmatimonadetes bacterium]|nr:protein kinase [Gemmatimonadota bacterium]
MRELGRGGMGIVFLARDLKHDRPVAIKALRPELALAVNSQRFLREIGISARLQHPNILALYDSGEADGMLYYVMPYVAGESLRQRLNREKQLTIEKTLAITSQVADALAYSHEAGVIHRDIKPENILLLDDHALVADFGIARAIDGTRLTETGLAIGTPEYMSPEQCVGDTQLDGRSDIYSLACVTFEMLVGDPPFAGPSAQVIIARQMHERPPSLRIARSTIPDHVEDALEKALAKIPADRFADAREFARALHRPELVAVKRRPIAVKRLLLGSALGLLLLAGWAVWSRPKRSSPGRDAVIVIPAFDHRSPSSPAAARLEAASRDLLTSYLGQLPGVQILDPGQSGALAPGPPIPARIQVADARRMGADYLLLGKLDGADENPAVAVELHSVRNGRLVTRTAGSGVPDHLSETIARIAMEIIRATVVDGTLRLGGNADLVSATTSPPALGYALLGQRQFWSGDLVGAATAFRHAIEADSTFGIAYHRLSVAQTWAYDYAAAYRTVEAGLARSGGLAPRSVRLLSAQRQFALRNADSAIAAFQTVVLDDSGNADGWLGLGESLYHLGGFAGYCIGDALPAFERLVALDTAFAPIYYHLVDLAILAGDEPRARKFLPRVDHGRGPTRELAIALKFAARREREKALAIVSRGDRQAVISPLVALFSHDRGSESLVDTLAGYLVSNHRTPADRTRGAQYRLVTGAALGKWPAAFSAWAAAPQRAPLDGWLLEGVFAGYPAAPAADSMFAWADSQVARGRAPSFRSAPLEDVYQAFWALAERAVLEGDSLQVLSLLRRLDKSAVPIDPADPGPPSLRAALTARLALLARDTARAVRLLETAVARPMEPWITFYPLLSMAPERFLLTTLLFARGDYRSGGRWLRSFSNTSSVADAMYHPQLKRLSGTIDDCLSVSRSRAK